MRTVYGQWHGAASNKSGGRPAPERVLVTDRGQTLPALAPARTPGSVRALRPSTRRSGVFNRKIRQDMETTLRLERVYALIDALERELECYVGTMG